MISARKPTIQTLRAAKKDPATTPAVVQAATEVLGEPPDSPQSSAYCPKPPATIRDTGLNDALVESLVFKYLLAVGHDTGRGIASAIALPSKPVIELLAVLKSRQFTFYKGSTTMGDFEYALTEAGRSRAKVYMDECSYVGPAPVTLEDYVVSVAAQSITLEQACIEDLRRAFDGLIINEHMCQRLGPAINSGRGLFLYGSPGNGKTSIAERITNCFGGHVWIPSAIVVAGELITFFDPQNHETIETEAPKILKLQAVDPRWVQVKRPTVVVGGELVMASLDLQHNATTKITEPSLQLKSNTGTLVIDDFGRQRMRPIELLNRWIVPLEKRYDFLTLANGKKIVVPFDQLIIFSTNIEPKELVDEAFLRRIPYKIEVTDPSEDEFRKLFNLMAANLGIDVEPNAVDNLIDQHYKAMDRPFRCCQPRDLLLQIKNQAAFSDTPVVANDETLEAAVENYFAVM